MTVSVLKTIADMSSNEWNHIARCDQVICRHDYLNAVEGACINDCRFFYPVVHEGTTPVGNACVYTIDTELDTFATGVAKRATNWMRRRNPRFGVMKSIECGTPVALGNTISLTRTSRREPALDLLVSSVEALADDLGIRMIVFRDMESWETTEFSLLERRGYHRVDNLPCTRLDVKWSSFGEYLDAMRSEYRSKVLSQQKTFAQTGCRIEMVDDLSRESATWANLWRNCYIHASEYRREVLTQAFFERLPQSGGVFRVLAARKNGQAIGFLLLMTESERITTLYAGLDYAESLASRAYFNMFYAAVDLAIREGKKEVDFGITTVEPKLDLGARVVPLYMYMKYRHPLLGWGVPLCFAAVTPSSGHRQRNVFKR